MMFHWCSMPFFMAQLPSVPWCLGHKKRKQRRSTMVHHWEFLRLPFRRCWVQDQFPMLPELAAKLDLTAHVRRKLCSQFFVKRTGHRMTPAFLLLNMAENLPDSELTANQQTMNMDMSQNWVPQNPIVQTCLKHQVPHENQTRFWVSTILRPAQFPWPNGCQSHPQRSRNSALCWDDPTTLGRPPSAATRVWLGWSLGWTVDHWLKSQAICETEHGETKVQQC